METARMALDVSPCRGRLCCRGMSLQSRALGGLIWVLGRYSGQSHDYKMSTEVLSLVCSRRRFGTNGMDVPSAGTGLNRTYPMRANRQAINQIHFPHTGQVTRKRYLAWHFLPCARGHSLNPHLSLAKCKKSKDAALG